MKTLPWQPPTNYPIETLSKGDIAILKLASYPASSSPCPVPCAHGGRPLEASDVLGVPEAGLHPRPGRAPPAPEHRHVHQRLGDHLLRLGDKFTDPPDFCPLYLTGMWF